MKRRRCSPAARRSSRSSAASPLGSMTIAPWPCSTARTATSAWVTVLPDPVAPTTSVCDPLRSPSGTWTAAPRESTPTTRPSRPTWRPARAARAAHAARSASRGPKRSAARWARSPPLSRSRRCQRALSTVAVLVAHSHHAAAPAPSEASGRANGTAHAAHVQRRSRRRRVSATAAPVTHASADRPTSPASASSSSCGNPPDEPPRTLVDGSMVCIGSPLIA